eukprot:scaffold2621_cov274-Chaetoceros_neogracile.AAC.4
MSCAAAFSLPNMSNHQNYKKYRTKHDHDTFESFVTMRTGIDLNNHLTTESKTESNRKEAECPAPGSSEAVYWVGEGQLYESPSGKIIANIEGFDVSKGVFMDQNHIRQFSRKIFWFRDPNTNELLTEYNGQPVQPIKYDWQVFDLKRGYNPNDPSMAPILPSVVKGPRSVPCMPVTPRYAGSDVIHYQCPLFIDIETPKGTYQAWEIYDYTLDLTHDANRPPSLSWSRQGSNPPFIQDGMGVMHFLGHRLDSFEELPEQIRTLVEEEYSLFQDPPMDMEEVHQLEQETMMRTPSNNGSVNGVNKANGRSTISSGSRQ